MVGVPLLQISGDLNWCNQSVRLADGTFPLVRWLENAVKFSAALKEGARLRQLLDEVEGYVIGAASMDKAIQLTCRIWPDPNPAFTRTLANRHREFELFDRMVTGQSPQRILLLRGSSSSGKSALLREMANYAKSLGLAHAHIDFKGCPSNDEIFESLKLDLDLRPAPGIGGSARLFSVIEHLRNLTKPWVLLFDTYEQASVEAHRWVETQLFPRLDRGPVVAVVGGQQTPASAHSAWQGLAESIDLEPIKRVEDWLEYSTRRWPSHDILREHVYALTLTCGGNPGQLAANLETFAGLHARAAAAGQS